MKNFIYKIFLIFFLVLQVNASDSDIENFVKRLYTNIFEREADSSGLGYWKGELKSGKSAVFVAKHFFLSSEMKNLNLSDDEYLNRSYKTFFDRDPDTGGKVYWKKQMNDNGMLKTQVFYGFCNSQEFKSVCQKYGITHITAEDKLKAFVERFYNYIFIRDGGESEIDYWYEGLNSGNKTAENIVKFFFFSDEFKAQNINNSEFVKRAYRTIMGREAENDGLDFWVGKLNGGKTREYVLDEFLKSDEFKNIKESFLEPSGDAIYVAVNGSDSNDGSKQRPYKTIQKAANLAKPGDTVYIRGGTYKGRIYIHNSGSKGKYITIRNYPGETPVITRDDNDFNYQTILLSGSSYIKIIGLHIVKTRSTGVRVQGPAEYIEFKDNEVSYQNADVESSKRIGRAVVFAGYKEAPLSHILIEGNKIHHNHTGRKGVESEGLTVYGKVEYFQIINNKVHHNDFIGINVIGKETGSYAHYGTPRYGIISSNEIYGNGMLNKYSSASYIDGAQDVIVENNYIHDNYGPGVAVNQEVKESWVKHVILRNNVIYKNYYNAFGSDANYGGMIEDSVFVHNTLNNTRVYDPSSVKQENLFYLGKGERNVIKNNLFYKDGGFAIMLEVAGRNNAALWEMDYNGFFPTVSQQNMIIRNNTIYKSIESYQAAGSAHAFSSADPMITSDFHLKNGSPCIDRGGFLTFTTNSGSGKVVNVNDARYFTGRWGIQKGEDIVIGTKKAVVVSSDYQNNTITIDRDLIWSKGEGVSYDYKGNAPDIGAYEY